ncbi:peptidase S41 [Sphaerochaeta globosa str. Buddy]|uniref:Peptidase S41 n=2 Tax=Sphaerochaeta TaxID=399320 RepID=F0RZ85_SPHGB|nr:peptidase S41 [Sphaerochaeta globosa str. Buddy]
MKVMWVYAIVACMKTRFSLILLSFCLAVLLLLAGCTTKLEVNNPMQADITYLYEKLPRLHVDFYHATSKADFSKAYHKAMENAESASDLDFYFSLRELVGYAQDSHTAVGLTEGFVAQLSAIPAQFSYVQGAWRLGVVERSHAHLLGSEIIAINDVPIEEVQRRASPLFSHDNEVWLRYYLSQQFNLTNLYTYIGIADSPSLSVNLTLKQRSTDQIHTITLTPVSAKEYGMLSFATWYQAHPETGASNAPYRALLLEENNTLFVQYNVCMSYEEYPLQSFIDEIVSLVTSKSFGRVIVDLRYNSGGDSRLFEPMVDGLAALQTEQGFALDVLIGEGTFSSALMNAMHFRQRTQARLVGTPTGGSLNHYGETAHFTLPNSDIAVSYSTKHFVMDRNYKGTSLVPDVVIEQTVEDILLGKDTVVETLLHSY